MSGGPAPARRARWPRVPAGEVWIFAYGALMWERGFPCAEVRRARLNGYHRAFCIYSHIYRGTPARPGLVLGLDYGGSCTGIALRLAGPGARDTLAAIYAREMVTGVYVARRLPVTLLDDGPGPAAGRRVAAHSFVADRRHRQYAGKLTLDHAARLIAEAAGEMGTCREYFDNTLSRLAELGIRDHGLIRLRARVAAHGGGR